MKRRKSTKIVNTTILSAVLLAAGILLVFIIIESQGIAISENNFPDAVFREYVRGFDRSRGGYLSEKEIKAVTQIEVAEGREVEEISTLQGIEYFTELKVLRCGRQPLGTLDVSSFAQLEELTCARIGLTELDVSHNPKLKILDCWGNGLTELNLSQNVGLEELYCGANQLEQLDVSNNTKLTTIHCQNNRLEFIDLSKLPNIDKRYIIMEGQSIELGEIDGGGIWLGTSGPGMDYKYVRRVKGATYDEETGMLTNYTDAPITYEYMAVDGQGRYWPMINITLSFTLK